MTDYPVFHYDPRPPSEQDAATEAHWKRVQREGADIVDIEGNVIGRILPNPEEPEPGIFSLNFAAAFEDED